jgi:hypothetical protein
MRRIVFSISFCRRVLLVQLVFTSTKSRAPAKPGPIVSEAKVIQLGKTIAFVEGKLLAQDGTLLATATACERLLDAARAIRS